MTTTAPPLDLEALLAPIPGDNPAGKDLQYEAIRGQLRAARTAAEEQSKPLTEEDRKQGFGTEVSASVDELRAQITRDTVDILIRRSKDLQIAVWLTEAQTHDNGFRGAAFGIQLVHGLFERFWDTVYPLPEPEEEKPLEQRARVIEAMAVKLAFLLKALPLTDGERDWTLSDYERAGQIATAKPRNDAEKAEKQEWIDKGYTTKAIDEAIAGAPLQHLDNLVSDITACQEQLALLEQFTNDRVVARHPKPGGGERIEILVGYSELKETLAECRRLVNRALVPKREAAKAARQAAEDTPPEEITPESPVDEPSFDVIPMGAAEAGPVRRGAAAAVTTRDEALARLQAAADYLLTESTSDPMPYLVDRALAFAALFAEGSLDASVPLPSPPTAVRARLKVLASEGRWEELLRAAEAFLRSAPKQAWLDLQRYVITALEQLGGSHAQTALALTPPLRTLLALVPGLVDAEFEDGTPVANQETHRWLREAGIIETPAVLTVIRPTQTAPSADLRAESSEPMPRSQPSIVEEAHALIVARRMGDALALLQQHASAATSGRERFLRRLELADVCLDAGNASLAFPILDDLASIIERGRIEEWEEKALVVRAWHSLVRCCRKLDAHPDTQAREKDIFDRLCRLDPAKALSLDSDAAASSARRHKR